MTTRRWAIVQSDAISFLNGLEADSCDLVLFSPPYEKARTYGIKFDLAGQAWVDWMVNVFQAALRACKGLVACVCQGQTRGYRWSAVPALLMADLHRAGVVLRNPPIFHRIGIPGSGGPDWLRGDTEFIICATRGGKLPWSDNTACGHPPRWAPGGEMSNRLSNGARVNQWGHPIDSGATGRGNNLGGRKRNGEKNKGTTGHLPLEQRKRRVSRGSANGDTLTSDSYDPPVLANPGNLISCKVGGGLMGHPLAHENEAPYPLRLCEIFVRSFAPPNGLVCDPFSGSGTTAHAAILHGRRFIGCDIRQSQVDIAMKRLESVTPMLLGV